MCARFCTSLCEIESCRHFFSPKCGPYLDNLLFLACLVPTITRPTRITSESATLIDNIYVSGNRLEYLRSGILVADISDHFPIFLFTGKNVRHCKPKNNTNYYIKLDTTAIDRINTLLLATYWSPLQQLHNY